MNFKRKRNRIEQFDYTSQNGYFITICTKDKKCTLGKIENGNIILSAYGIIVENKLKNIKTIYRDVEITKMVVMPNHIHFIILIENTGAANLSKVVQQFKGAVSKEAKQSIWHKSFYEHVIRNETDYLRIWEYIDENITKWDLDEYHM